MFTAAMRFFDYQLNIQINFDIVCYLIMTINRLLLRSGLFNLALLN